MEEYSQQSATEWAVMTYGLVRLGDQRRTERAVKLAGDLAHKPMALLPEQMGSQAAYRFLQSPQVSYERLMRPHLEQTRELMKQQSRVLLILS